MFCPLVDAWPAVGSASPVDVSRAAGAQSEVALAIDPAHSRWLLAGSNDGPGNGRMRVYGSGDGGLRWSSAPGPPRAPDGNYATDPAVGIDLAGRQFYAFISLRADFAQLATYVATRVGPTGRWVTPGRAVAPPGRGAMDDKDALTVDTSGASPFAGRVYVAFTRITGGPAGPAHIVVAHNSGNVARRPWSHPVRVDDLASSAAADTYVALATSRSGALYVAWHDEQANTLVVDRSSDGGLTFGRDHRIARVSTRFTTTPACRGGGVVIPAQSQRCVLPNPTLAVDRSRGPRTGTVYVTWADVGPGGIERLRVAALAPDGGLRRGFPRTIPSVAGADRFLPASAVDQRSGALVVCFYDTAGDSSRRTTRFSCLASADGAQTFSRATPLTTLRSDETDPRADANQYGDYAAVAITDGTAHAAWTARTKSTLAEDIESAAIPVARLLAR